MFITRNDFAYFEHLFNILTDAERKNFVNKLSQIVRKDQKAGLLKVHVVDESFRRRDVPLAEFLQRRMIKKAYDLVKGR